MRFINLFWTTVIHLIVFVLCNGNFIFCLHITQNKSYNKFSFAKTIKTLLYQITYISFPEHYSIIIYIIIILNILFWLQLSKPFINLSNKHFDDKKILIQFKQYENLMITNQFQHLRDIIAKINLRLVYHIKWNTLFDKYYIS